MRGQNRAKRIGVMLEKLKMDAEKPFFAFCDSSWNDDVDSGHSTGCFLIYYMGGVVTLG